MPASFNIKKIQSEILYVKRYYYIFSMFFLLIAFVLMAKITWLTWCDPFIDFGRELYVPLMLTQGKNLFSDIQWYNGCFSQYFNSFLFSIFGSNIKTIIWSNITILIIALTLLFLLICRIGNILSAFFACLIFITVFAFGNYTNISNYNWITPYSHEITHGIILSIIAFYLQNVGVIKKSKKLVFASGLIFGLCFLTKIEVIIAVSFSLAILFYFEAINRRFNLIVSLLSGLLTSFTISCLQIGSNSFFSPFESFSNREISQLTYYQVTMGLDEPLQKLCEMFVVAGIWSVFIGILIYFSFKVKKSAQSYLAKAIFIFLIIILLISYKYIQWTLILRPLPIFLIAISFFEIKKKKFFEFSITTFSFLLLLKIFFNTSVLHYGFALTAPAMIVITVFLLKSIPDYIIENSGQCLIYKSGITAFIIFFIGIHIFVTYSQVESKNVLTGKNSNIFRANDTGHLVNLSLEYLEKHKPTSLVVIPEGVMLNFLSGIPNPTPYINFMPPEEILFGDNNWSKSFNTYPPELIFFLPKDTTEYGRGQFGVGYGKSLATEIKKGYQHFETIKSSKSELSILVFKRRALTENY